LYEILDGLRLKKMSRLINKLNNFYQENQATLCTDSSTVSQLADSQLEYSRRLLCTPLQGVDISRNIPLNNIIKGCAAQLRL